MKKNEEVGPSDSEKPSSPARVSIKMDQNKVPVYPDWATMQAFYGPQFAMPTYMNSAIASPHMPLPYMWGPPQSMIPPYGAPYAAFYAHGGVDAHPGIPPANTALIVETPVKSSGAADGGFVDKLKDFNGLAMSIGNRNGDSAEYESGHGRSDSEATEGSSDGSNGVKAAAVQNSRKRSRQGSPNKDMKTLKEVVVVPTVEGNCAPSKVINVVPPANTKPMENMNIGLEEHPSLSLKSSPSSGPQPSLPNEAWLQTDREIKRERRKLSNRESARRSRLRKQAETEELAAKVQALVAENMTLKSELNKLMEGSKKLKVENTALMDKLRAAKFKQLDNPSVDKINDQMVKPIGTVNLLARVNNNDDSGDPTNDNGELCGNNKSTGVKLHQLLDANPRTDTVVVG